MAKSNHSMKLPMPTATDVRNRVSALVSGGAAVWVALMREHLIVSRAAGGATVTCVWRAAGPRVPRAWGTQGRPAVIRGEEPPVRTRRGGLPVRDDGRGLLPVRRSAGQAGGSVRGR